MLSIKVVVMFWVGVIAVKTSKLRRVRFKKKDENHVLLSRIIDQKSFELSREIHNENKCVIN